MRWHVLEGQGGIINVFYGDDEDDQEGATSPYAIHKKKNIIKRKVKRKKACLFLLLCAEQGR
jgi:hypothetical protein